MQSACSYDISSGNNPSIWLTSLTNTWNYQNAQRQWQQSTLVQNAYTFDNAGQRLTNHITSNGSSRTEYYGYDELNRLRTVDYGDGQTQSYTFDALGNRTSKQDSVSGTENYAYNVANMLLTQGTNNYVNDTNWQHVDRWRQNQHLGQPKPHCTVCQWHEYQQFRLCRRRHSPPEYRQWNYNRLCCR